MTSPTVKSPIPVLANEAPSSEVAVIALSVTLAATFVRKRPASVSAVGPVRIAPPTPAPTLLPTMVNAPDAIFSAVGKRPSKPAVII